LIHSAPPEVKEKGSAYKNAWFERTQSPLARCQPMLVLAISKRPSMAPASAAAITIGVGILGECVEASVI
jgi:hypothetical protein